MAKRNRLKIVWFFLNQYKFNFLFLIVLATIVGILETLNVALIYPILSTSLEVQIASNPFLNFINIFVELIPIDDTLIGYCIIFIILACLVFAIKLLYAFLSARFTSNVAIASKQALFSKYTNSDYQFFIDNRQGELYYKIAGAPLNIARLMLIISNITIDVILSVSIFILLLSISWKGTVLVFVGGIGFYYLTKHLSSRISYVAGRKKLESAKEEAVVLNEYINGVKQIKVFDTAPFWKNLFDKAISKYWHFYRKNYFWQVMPGFLLFMLVYISIGFLIIFIKLQYPSSFISIIPGIATFIFAVFTILPKLSNFGAQRMEFMHILPDVEVVYNILKDTAYDKIKNGDKEFVKIRSGISLRNVKFTYKNREVLLNSATLELKKDAVTALVGPSGSGKSTIVDLLLRLYDVEEGGVYIDNTNIKEYDILSFLKKIGFVSQDTFIYNASVKDNIVFGKDYTEGAIIEAAKLANADEFIQQLPEQYDTSVGDRGMRLSGGEKQRIAIARAMIRKPEMLILDEATSSLDTVSESAVQMAINKVSKKCTTFIIAHRLSTIQNADVIYVINKGKIVESGTHGQLLDKKGKYWELYNIQNVNSNEV